VLDHASIKYNSTSNKVFIFGGLFQDKELLVYDMTFNNYSIAANLSYLTSVASSFHFGTKAYIFSRTTGLTSNLQLDLDTYEMKVVGPPTVPIFYPYGPATATDDQFGYIIGGYDSTEAGNPPTDGILQFNPSTYETSFIPVNNFPVNGSWWYYNPPGSVFVPKLNRIYCFAGYSRNSSSPGYSASDQIFYIDLSPLGTTTSTSNPTTMVSSITNNLDHFICVNRKDGNIFIIDSKFSVLLVQLLAYLIRSYSLILRYIFYRVLPKFRYFGLFGIF
jgi:hypothetical protein